MSAQWKDLVARARKKQLQPQEYLSGRLLIFIISFFFPFSFPPFFGQRFCTVLDGISLRIQSSVGKGVRTTS